MPSVISVAGVDTDAGKTVATAALLRAVAGLGMSARGLKPVQTGAPPALDGAVYRAAAPGATVLTLATFAKPCSPHWAAELENRSLTAADLLRQIREALDPDGCTVIEGAGGWLVPINDTETLADVFTSLDAPVVVTAANRLGVVNHALLTLEAIRARGLTVASLVLVQTQPPDDPELARNNIETLRRRAGTDVLDLPHAPAFTEAVWTDFAQRLAPLARRLAAPPAADGTAAVLSFDREHVWHPYAGVGTDAPVWEAVRTRGTRIQLADGRWLVDGMASWWAAIHGYNHPALTGALRRQAARMPHVMFGGLTHAPAVDLAGKLLALAPENLRHVFFADSGSVAVEVALKMAVQGQRARGDGGRRKILAPRGGYHGDTLGAMSVGDPRNGMHRHFAGVLPEQVFTDRPGCRFDRPFDAGSLAGVAAILEKRGDEFAAVIVEPVAQGAGGMWFYHPDWLRGLSRLCREHGVFLILDEIATGFGRTGKMFASEWAGVDPDIVCVGKALTGGVMTLAATLCTSAIAGDITAVDGALMHGPTFMANPLACAVAGASLDLLADGTWRERVGRIEDGLRQGLEPLRGAAGVADVRVLGAIGVVEMERPVALGPLQRFFVDEGGVWLRPFGRLVYLMPSYIMDAQEIDRLTGAIRAAVEGGVWAG